MNITLIRIPLVVAGCMLAGWSLQADQAAKRSISTVMKDAMKGDTSLHKTVALGKGTDSDAATLLDYYKSLPAETPPEGDAAKWQEKTAKLIAAAQAVVDKKPGATAQLQTAGNCKACHNEHKGK
ncbi:MAG TPA: hypothetical protein VLE43_14335 [Candidatus Saccharimonadia bacterium]|nr:hypothetical protein [Candidatus Saccharimonadia bacterium]